MPEHSIEEIQGRTPAADLPAILALAADIDNNWFERRSARFSSHWQRFRILGQADDSDRPRVLGKKSPAIGWKEVPKVRWISDSDTELLSSHRSRDWFATGDTYLWSLYNCCFPHLALAACRAISLRRSLLSLAARALPPTSPAF